MDWVEGENGHGDQQDPAETNKTQSELLRSLSNSLMGGNALFNHQTLSQHKAFSYEKLHIR